MIKFASCLYHYKAASNAEERRKTTIDKDAADAREREKMV